MSSGHDLTADPAASPEGKEKMINDEDVQVTAAQSSPGLDEADYEKYGAGRESNPLPDLKRKLKSRHLQMIAIGMSWDFLDKPQYQRRVGARVGADF